MLKNALQQFVGERLVENCLWTKGFLNSTIPRFLVISGKGEEQSICSWLSNLSDVPGSQVVEGLTNHQPGCNLHPAFLELQPKPAGSYLRTQESSNAYQLKSKPIQRDLDWDSLSSVTFWRKIGPCWFFGKLQARLKMFGGQCGLVGIGQGLDEVGQVGQGLD